MRRPPRRAVLLLPLLALAIAACNSSEPAVCSDVDSLKNSVDSLKDTKVGDENALATWQSDLSKIQTEIVQLKDDAQKQFSSEIDALDKAAKSMKSSLTAAQQDATASSLAAVGTAAAQVGSALSTLEQAVSDTC